MLTDPKFTPVTSGCVAGTVAPCGMNTVAGTVAVVGSLLERLMVAPPNGAPAARLIGRVAVWFGPTVTPAPI